MELKAKHQDWIVLKVKQESPSCHVVQPYGVIVMFYPQEIQAMFTQLRYNYGSQSSNADSTFRLDTIESILCSQNVGPKVEMVENSGLWGSPASV